MTARQVTLTDGDRDDPGSRRETQCPTDQVADVGIFKSTLDVSGPGTGRVRVGGPSRNRVRVSKVPEAQ